MYLGERLVLEKLEDPSIKCPVYTVPNSCENDDQLGLTYSWGTRVFISPTVVYNGDKHNRGSHIGMASGGPKDDGDQAGQQDSQPTQIYQQQQDASLPSTSTVNC